MTQSNGVLSALMGVVANLLDPIGTGVAVCAGLASRSYLIAVVTSIAARMMIHIFIVLPSAAKAQVETPSPFPGVVAAALVTAGVVYLRNRKPQ